MLGMIGFLEILEHVNKQDKVEIYQNYITFDTEELKEFAQDYFTYFFDIYNIANKTNERIQKCFIRIQHVLEQEDKTTKELQNQLKKEKKYLKDIIKIQLDKVKKIDEKMYQTMLENYEQIDNILHKEDMTKLQQILERIQEQLGQDKINKKLTLNFFKSILSKSYFGQPSFLNVLKTALSYEEQQEIMYKDYISNIVELGFLEEMMQEKYSIDEVKKKLLEKLEKSILTEQVTKIYQDILKKYIEKQKGIDEIQQFLQQKVFSTCSICENEHMLTSSYTESNFVPLAISSDNMRNFFWNQNATLPICDICKLMLFCIPAGVTAITKTVKEREKSEVIYKEKEVYSFVNYDTSVEMLQKTNRFFKGISKRDKTITHPYQDLILNIVKQEQQISTWQLSNIFIIEFEAEYLAYSRTEYFNIKRQVAEFFRQYATTTIQLIKDNNFKLQLIDNILKGKDFKSVIGDKLRRDLTKINTEGYDCFLATQARSILQRLKKEEYDLEEKIEKDNGKLYLLYKMGVSIHETLKQRKELNKLDGYTYRLLNCIKTENKKEFMDIVIRLHMAMDKDVSGIFLEIMQQGKLDMASIGHAFCSGLISNKYEKESKEEISNG